MSTLMVGYDLNKPGKDYTSLIQAIKDISGTWWHHLDSTWFVVTTKTTTEVRDMLAKFVDGNDEVLVVNVSDDGWSSWGLSQDANNWLKRHV